MKPLSIYRFLVLAAAVLALYAAYSTARAQTPAQNKQHMKALYVAFENQDWAVFDQHIAADVNDHTIPPGMKNGREGIRELFKLYKGAFPDSKNIVEDIIAEGNYVAGRVRFVGTNDGPLMGTPATHKKIDIIQMDVVRFDQNGLAVEHWGLGNDLGIFRQLGLAPAPPPLPAALPMEGTPVGKPAKTTAAQNKQSSLAFFERFTGGRIDECLRLFAPLFKVHFNDETAPLSAGAYGGVGAMYLKSFPALKFTPIAQVAEGNKVVTVGTYAGTQTGELMGLPASGKAVEFTDITFDRYNQGLIAERWDLGDQYGMLVQLGVLPAPGENQAKK